MQRPPITSYSILAELLDEAAKEAVEAGEPEEAMRKLGRAAELRRLARGIPAND